MLLGDGCAVADPRTDDVQRVRSRQFGLTARPEIVEQLWPRFQTCPLYDPHELRAKVLVAVTVARNQMNRSGFRQLEGVVECSLQLWNDRNPSLAPVV
jgi:hypothetical protein